MISIITVGRADNHTGDFTGRLIYTAQFNQRALAAAGIPHRFVFVEWNSPHVTLGSVAQRYVAEVPNSKAYVVGPEWHNEVCDNPNMVIMEFFAKNVALRRCDTPVALCTNADILFGTDTLAIMSRWRECKPRVMYRAIHRHDVRNDITYKKPEDLMTKDIIVKSWTAKGPAFTQGAGDFQMADTQYWQSLKGFDETIRWAKIHKDHRMCTQVVHAGGKIVAEGSCYHVYHKSSYVNQTKFPENAPWGPEYNPKQWMPYKNPSSWGLLAARTYRMGEVELLLPPLHLRTVPELTKILKPIEPETIDEVMAVSPEAITQKERIKQRQKEHRRKHREAKLRERMQQQNRRRK